MENIVDSPTRGQLKAIGQIRELVLDFKGAMSLAHKFWRRFISREVGCLKPNQISDLKARVFVFPSIVHSFRNLLRPFDCAFAFLLCLVDPADLLIGLIRLSGTWDIHKGQVISIVHKKGGCVN